MISTEIHIPLLIFLFAIFWLLSILGTVYYFHRLLRRERKLKDGMDQLLTFTDLCTFVFDMRKDTMRLSTACANLLGLPEEVDNFTEKCQEDSDQHKSCQSLLQAMTPEADQQRMQLTRANGSYGTYRVTNRIYYTKNEEIDYIIGILTDITQEVHREEHLALHAQIDGLTHVYNSGTVRRLLSDTMTDFDENDLGAFLILDIDNFKKFNDLYGHHTGDEVLREIADVLQAVAEASGGCAGRWGGEEFFLLLPDTNEEEAMTAAEHLRMSVGKRSFSGVGKVTISLGVITVQGEADRRQVFSSIDSALYQAKAGGRNRTVRAELS
jgi:diguanylate cyclase (GGDEF)-like protein